MSGGGSGSNEPGPPFPSEAEALRRQLYRPGGLSEDELARYEGLTTAATPSQKRADERDPVIESDESTLSISRRPAAFTTSARTLRTRLSERTRKKVLIVVIAMFACAVIAALLSGLGPPALPRTVPVPAASGTTLIYHSRTSDPASSRSATVFTTPEYTIFDPHDRRIAVALRCVGAGQVRIYAGRRFNFRCTERERVQQQRTPEPLRSPFTVYALTSGNVVWSVRIVRQ